MHACMCACVHACVCVHMYDKRVSDREWSVPRDQRSDDVWRDRNRCDATESLIGKRGSLVHAEIERRVADRRRFPPIGDRAPRANFTPACKHRLPFVFSSRASASEFFRFIIATNASIQSAAKKTLLLCKVQIMEKWILNTFHRANDFK